MNWLKGLVKALYCDRITVACAHIYIRFLCTAELSAMVEGHGNAKASVHYRNRLNEILTITNLLRLNFELKEWQDIAATRQLKI